MNHKVERPLQQYFITGAQAALDNHDSQRKLDHRLIDLIFCAALFDDLGQIASKKGMAP